MFICTNLKIIEFNFLNYLNNTATVLIITTNKKKESND